MSDVVYLVQYPVSEDGCIQYRFLAFVDRVEANAFARKHDSKVTIVPVV